MSTLESTTRTELDGMPEQVRTGTLAAAALDLARRLDGEPADTAAVLLVRELRMVMGELRELAKGGAVDEVEQFLAGVRTPTFDAGH